MSGSAHLCRGKQGSGVPRVEWLSSIGQSDLHPTHIYWEGLAQPPAPLDTLHSAEPVLGIREELARKEEATAHGSHAK